ncbi:MAG: aromatic ring-hydroxylating dioxygenase subunit alpha [Gammaproteobacteria bacterium]|nr:aromatic ring-hydroxylating dioxygenase subunit alpha [Gammaproteobacteria bacterium]
MNATTRTSGHSHTNSTGRWTARFPRMGQGPLPASAVTDPQRFAAERDAIYRRCWLHVGRIEEIPDAGDWFVQAIEIAGASILVMRGRDGEVRAFHNICRHRGNRLAMAPRGTAATSRLACRFHGWTYDDTGTLCAVPQQQNFFTPTCGELNLKPVACDSWNGFIFVNLDPAPAEDLIEYLGPIADYCDGYAFDRLPGQFAYRAEVAANWKLVMDGQSETYHVAFVHKDSWPRVFTTRDNPFGRNLDMRFYERHRTWSAAGGDFTPQGIEALALANGPSVADAGDFKLDDADKVNPTRDPAWAFDAVHVFPNLHILLLPGVYHTHQFWPIDLRRTRWELRVHMPPPATPAQAFSREHAKVFLRDALLEDGILNEQIQASCDSGAIGEFHLQDEESFVRHGYWAIEQAIAAADGEGA